MKAFVWNTFTKKQDNDLAVLQVLSQTPESIIVFDHCHFYCVYLENRGISEQS